MAVEKTRTQKAIEEARAYRETIAQDKAKASQVREQAIKAEKWPTKQQTGSGQSENDSVDARGGVGPQTAELNTKAMAGEHAQGTRAMAAAAEKAYNDYLQSDERKQNMSKAMAGDTAAMLMNGLPGLESFRPSVDEKERDLETAMNYWKERVRQEEDWAVTEKNLAELESWPEEDRRALEQYVFNRDTAFYNRLQGMDLYGAQDPYLQARGLIEKYGQGKVDNLAESYRRSENEKMTQNVTRAAQEGAGSGFLAGAGHSAASVGARLIGSISGVLGYANEMGYRTGQYSTLDPNNAGNIPNVYASAAQGEVTENIKNSEILRQMSGALASAEEFQRTGSFDPAQLHRNMEQGSNVLGDTASVGYQGAMSAAESIARVAATGGAGALALAAAGSFGQTLSDASRQGATPVQAAILATANATVETLSEKIPLDNLLDTAKAGKQPIGEIVKRAFAQAGIEATTEEISLVGEFINEAVILQEKSSYNQQIGDLVANGMSYGEAKAQASKGVWDEAVNTFLVSAASGGISSAGGSLFANIFAPNAAPETAQPSQDAGTILNEQQPAQAESAPQEATGAVEAAPTDIIGDTVDKLNANGTVSNRQAEAILANPEAVKLLVEQVGMQDPIYVRTQTEKRNAVKQAIRQLAGGGVPTELSPEGKQILKEDIWQNLWDDSPAAQGQAVQPEQAQANPDFQRAIEKTFGTEAGETVAAVDAEAKERGLRYKASKVNSAILDMVDRVKKGLTKGNEKVQLGTVSDSNAEQIQRETGIDTHGYYVAIEARQIAHILKDHGENGVANHSMADPTDIARIEYALNNPDRITKSDPTKAYVTNKNGKMKPADTVLYETRLEDGSYYVVQAVPETKNKTLYVLTAFIGKSDYNNEAPRSTAAIDPSATPKAESVVTPTGAPQSTNINGHDVTPEADSVGTSTHSIPQNGAEVNGDLLYGNAPPEFLEQGAVGAAERNFTGTVDYDVLLSDQNAQRDRPNDVRPVEVPKTDAQGKRVSEFVGNAYGSALTPDSFIPTIRKLVMDGSLSHDVQTNEKSLELAAQAIAVDGLYQSVQKVRDTAREGKTSANDEAKAMLLYNYLVGSTDQHSQEMAADVFTSLSQLATNSGRSLQLFSMFRKMTPDGQLSAVQTNVQRYVDKLNQNRAAKKQLTVDTPAELAQDYLDAAKDEASAENAVTSGIAMEIDTAMQESLSEAAGKAIDTVPWNGSEENAEYSGQGANIQTNDMAERVGQRVANNLTAEARQGNQSVEDVLYREIMRFANDKANAGRTVQERTKNQNLTALRDHYRYRAFFQTAWDIARNRVQQTMNTMSDGDPRIQVIEQFLASGDEVLGIENESPVSAVDYANPKSTIRRATKEAAAAAGIRMDNRSETVRSEVRQKMRDILVENAQEKEKAANRIAEIAMDGLDLDEKSADAMASDIVRAFYNDLAEQSARRVAEMFSIKENKTAQNVQETLAEKLEKLYNMGAFSYPEYRSAVMESLFGREGIDIPDSLIDKFVQAAGERKQAALDQIYMNAAAQIPATLGEKFNALRHMAMLGSTTTHIRNFGATGAFRPMASIKRTISAGIQAATLDQQNRTAAVIGIGKESRELLSWAKSDAKTDTAKSMIKGTYQNGDEARNAIAEYRTIFKNKGLESTRQFISNALEAEDMVWKKREYALTLASFLKSRGYTAQQAQSGSVPENIMAEGRQLAVQEALKSTFNDQNRFSDMMSKFRKKGSDPVSKAMNIMAEGILPYTRTPANIGIRGVEYSPAGLLKSFVDLTVGVKNGKKTVAQGIDELAAGLTGTGVLALGIGLAAGMVPGVRLVGEIPEDDEQEEATQEYAIEIGGKSYGIGWVAPATIPLFVGANLYNRLRSAEGDGELDAWDYASAFIGALKSGVDPILELSCMSGINYAIEKMSYEETAGDKMTSLLYHAATSYFLQAVPTVFGQIEKAAEPNKKKTFSNAETDVQRAVEQTIGSTFRKLPGDPYQIDSVDAYGNIQKEPDNPALRIFNAFLNPTTVQDIDRSPLTMEIKRLNSVQPESVNMPSIPKTISYTDTDGNEHSRQRLTAEQYSTLEKVQKQTASEILNQLIGTDAYKNLTDAQKADVFGYVYDYAREKGRTEAVEGYSGMESWMEGIEGKEAKTILDKAMTAGFTDAFSALTDSWGDGGDGMDAVESLEQAFSVYDGMSGEEKRAFREEAGGRLGYFLEAREAGVSTETFTGLYKIFYDIDKRTDIGTSEKAGEWAYQLEKAEDAGKLTGAQKRALKDSMVYYQMFPAQTEKFDQMTEAGISADKAKTIGTLLEGIVGTGAVDEETGKPYVRDIDKREAIAESGLSNSEIDTIMHVYMPDYDPTDKTPDKTELKYDAIRDMGISPAGYAYTYRIYADTTGTGKKNRIIKQYMEDFGCSREVATQIYKIYAGKSKPWEE